MGLLVGLSSAPLCSGQPYPRFGYKDAVLHKDLVFVGHKMANPAPGIEPDRNNRVHFHLPGVRKIEAVVNRKLEDRPGKTMTWNQPLGVNSQPSSQSFFPGT